VILHLVNWPTEQTEASIRRPFHHGLASMASTSRGTSTKCLCDWTHS